MSSLRLEKMASHSGEDTEALLGGEKKKKHSHAHGEKKKKHSHAHGEKEHGHSHAKKHKKKKKSGCCSVLCDIKLLSFIVIGGLTLLYCIAELGMAIYLSSLTLLSDGFHNLSDVIALYIAFWAAQASKRDVSDSMSYGWVRSEILGGLTNGCFLLSLCLYVTLESIPRFIKPTAMTSGWPFIGVAAGGLAVNTIGTLVFAATGMSHGHSHSHGGGHGHSHGSHGHGDKAKKHGHAHGDKKKKKKEKGHGHDHGHGHGKKKKKDGRCGFDMNTWAVFIHYAGDMVSSLVVLIMGFLIKFVPEGKWMDYIDPAASLVIVALILWTTVPLVKDCSMILLQSTPSEIELSTIRTELRDMAGVENVHDLHVWQLVDGMVISSVHLAVEEGTDFSHIADEAKGIFHDHGIHSSTIQPEFVPKNYPDKPFCESNCVKDCAEDWCCKKTADRHKAEKDDDHGHEPSLRRRSSHSHNGHDHDHDHDHDHAHDDHHDHDHDHDDHDHDGHGHHHHHDEENGNGGGLLLHDDDDDDILPRRNRPADPSLLINI